jgi:type IV pilus assembly protein PilQ
VSQRIEEEKEMKRRVRRPAAGLGGILAALATLATLGTHAWSATIDSMDFSNSASGQELIIRANGPLDYQTEVNAEDKQFVLTFKDAQFSKRADRRLDASNFPGPLSLATPSNASGGTGPARLVLQLRENVEPKVVADGNSLRISLGGVGASATSSTVSEQDPYKAAAEKGLELFVETQASKSFKGRKITLRLRDTPLSDVLSMIAEASGFNIILGDGIEGKLTLSLVDVPWDQALDVILTTRRLGAERKNNVLRITTLANLTAEKEEQIKAKLASEKAAPRATRIFPISYADIDEIRKIISGVSDMFSDPTVTGQAAGQPPGQPAPGQQPQGQAGALGNVQVDLRTNSVIIRDTYENLERIKKLIQLLDVETPQVLIEAKVVEATEEFNKVLSGQLGFSRVNAEGRGLAGTFNASNAFTGLSGSTVSSTAGAGAVAYSPTIAFLPPVIDRLNLLIQMQEEEEKVRVISAPKMVVLNRKPAKILKATPFTINEVGVGQGNVPIVAQKVINANLSLEARPTVTNSNSVMMGVQINRDAVINNLPAARNISTEVLVDNGSTLVIGGIFTSDETRRKSGFPFLKELPILGWLFGSSENTQSRSELVIFLTPRILTGEKAPALASPEAEPPPQG